MQKISSEQQKYDLMSNCNYRHAVDQLKLNGLALTAKKDFPFHMLQIDGWHLSVSCI